MINTSYKAFVHIKELIRLDIEARCAPADVPDLEGVRAAPGKSRSARPRDPRRSRRVGGVRPLPQAMLPVRRFDRGRPPRRACAGHLLVSRLPDPARSTRSR